jgi:hypothetical protein
MASFSRLSRRRRRKRWPTQTSPAPGYVIFFSNGPAHLSSVAGETIQMAAADADRTTGLMRVVGPVEMPPGASRCSGPIYPCGAKDGEHFARRWRPHQRAGERRDPLLNGSLALSLGLFIAQCGRVSGASSVNTASLWRDRRAAGAEGLLRRSLAAGAVEGPAGHARDDSLALPGPKAYPTHTAEH